jgi:hypothetical protein
MMTYQDVQPWAVAIKAEVLSRRMPPWGAVKGFGEFRDDEGLAQKEVELISDWVDGGIRRGNNTSVLPKVPKFNKPVPFKIPKDGIELTGEFTLDRQLTLAGLFPRNVPSGASPQIVAEFPDGKVLPLIWLYEYKDAYQHPFFFRNPIDLPLGTRIRGVPPEARLILIPGKNTRGKK